MKMQKAKTVKEFKHSNKKLYKDLMKERAKHQTASKIIGNLKHQLDIVTNRNEYLKHTIDRLFAQNKTLQDETATYKQNVTEFTRNLFN